jgi:hypothetical protein
MYNGAKAKITFGEFGLMTDISPDKQPQGAPILANNVVFTNGNIQKAPGSVKWNQTALSAGIVAVHHWMPTLVQEQYIAVTDDGNIYSGRDRQFGSAINATVASTLTPNCVFAEGGAEDANNAKKLFLFTNGRTLPLVMSGNGTAFATIATPNEDWTDEATYPKFGVVHRGALWAFAGQRSYASSTSNHEDFSDASLSFVDGVYPGEGGELRGGFVFKTKLFAFKDGGFVYTLNDSDVSAANWYWQKAGSNFGLAAPNAVDEVLNDLIAGNVTGTFNSYAATEKLGSVEAGDICQQLQFESFLRGNTSKSGVPEQHVLYYGEKKQLFATYRSTYKATNDMLIMFDFARSANVRPAFWIKGSPQCLALYKDSNQIERPMYGGADGFIYLMDREDRLEGSTAYTGEFQTAHTDFSWMGDDLASKEKHFDFLAVHYVPESSGDLSCDFYVDGRYIDTLTFPMIQYERPKLGTLILGTDRLGQNQETAIRQLSGTGRTFSARFYQSGSNQSFQVPAITVFFRPGGEGAQKV